MLQMKLCGDLILREKCDAVVDITPELLSTMDEMVEMMDKQHGVGLAAPQVGITKRFIVMMNPKNHAVYRMINPEIISRSEETCVKEEGCLSVLGADELPVFADVSRPESVDVKWIDEKGAPQQAHMSGLLARIVQHETDHLDGVLFFDYLPGVKREMLMRKVKRKH